MEEWDDLPHVNTHSSPRWFDPEALRPLHNLNHRLFEVVIDEWRRGPAPPDIATLGAKLARLDDGLLWRLARVPVCWIDAEFSREEGWTETDASTGTVPTLPDCPLPRARALELAGVTFALAAATAKESRETACIMFGMRPKVADSFARFSVETLHRLGQTHAHWVRPRWYETPQDWDRMIATAEHADVARLPPVSLRVLNRMLADLEPAT